LPVTPGTKFITVGGAIAHDIHGKNHHGEGSFSNFVEQLTLILADGTPLVCSKDVHADVFWATISGAGLTGFILEATFRLKKIESAYIRQTSIKAPNLDTIFGQFEENEAQYPYSVAWLDCLATSRNLGRSLLLLGHHAPSGELSSKQKRTPLLTHQDPKFRIPFDFPTFVLNRFSIKSFNTLFYHKQLSTTKTSILHYDPYFYPLDIMADWNKMYGKRGFVQYQCVFPLAASHEALTQLLKRVHQYGMASFLAVLKKFGKPDQGLLTFPMHGYTLTMDFPMNSSLPAFIAELDRLVLDFGGRVYLAKDALLSPASFRAMYPNFDTWRSIKTRLDPENKFHSHLAKRLEI
jgi:FAD/FMN-containing dehydrogenase